MTKPAAKTCGTCDHFAQTQRDKEQGKGLGDCTPMEDFNITVQRDGPCLWERLTIPAWTPIGGRRRAKA